MKNKGRILIKILPTLFLLTLLIGNIIPVSSQPGYDISFQVASSSPFGATIRATINATPGNVQMVVLNLDDIRAGIPPGQARQQQIKYSEVNQITVEDFEVKTPIMGERDITINDVIARASPLLMPGEISTEPIYPKETTDYLEAIRLANTVTVKNGGQVGDLKAPVIGKVNLTDTFKDAPEAIKADLDKILSELPDKITDVVDYDIKVIQEEVKLEIVKNKSPTLAQAFSVSQPMTLEATVTSGGFYDGQKWGSTGVLALIIDGQYYYDMSNSSWWSTAYEHRIEITIDTTNVDADLTDYPVYLNLSNSSGITNADVTAIFDEVGASYLKIVVANSDNTAQFYTEVVSWDSVGETAELWTKVSAVDDATDTTIYLYYDLSQADNSTYVGVVGSTAGKAVWDANFAAVYHMNDNPDTSHIADSTGNHNGTKKGANEPIEASGIIGKAQSFDGSDDYINLGVAAIIATDDYSLEMMVKPVTPANNTYDFWYVDDTAAGSRVGFYYATEAGVTGLYFARYDSVSFKQKKYVNTFSTVDYTFVAAVSDTGASLLRLYVSGVQVDSQAIATTLRAWLSISRLGNDLSLTWPYQGLEDEVRISNIARSDAHIKANNFNFTDALVTFGSEETYVPPVLPNFTRVTSPFRIKSANWLQIEIRWPNVEGATEYMLRVKTKEYPGTQASGTLVYQGTAIAALDFKGINKRYTLFYKDAGGSWQNIYRGHY